MFRENCLKCNKKISKKYSYCPHCGFDRKAKKKQDEYGFLGKDEFDDLQLPFGFKMLIKPLMKEFNKQMFELDKEFKKEGEVKKANNTMKVSNFTIHIGVPGQKPVRMSGSMPSLNINTNKNRNVPLILPKIDKTLLLKAKELPREEPETLVRRLSDRLVYELSLPDVNSINNINITKLEDSIEVKAVSNKSVYFKTIDVSLPLVNYYFSDAKLVIELGLK